LSFLDRALEVGGLLHRVLGFANGLLQVPFGFLNLAFTFQGRVISGFTGALPPGRCRPTSKARPGA
jgi:hypothetical protein